MGKAVCWNLTPECNKDCNYCFRELNEPAQSLYTNISVLHNLKEQDFTRITFSGGEPFMYPYILELIEAAHSLGFECQVVTNASMINENNFKEYFKYISKVSFSCDSSDPYINKISGRGMNNYEHIKDVIRLLRTEFSKDKLTININSVVTHNPNPFRMVEELQKTYDDLTTDLYQYDINLWKVIRFYPLRGKALANANLLSVAPDVFQYLKEYFTRNVGLINIEFRDIKDMDKDIIVSPMGSLKQSDQGKEIPYIGSKVVDCKSSCYKKGGVEHV